MNKRDDRGRFDWLVELGGAAALAAAAGYAAVMIGPAYGWPVGPALLSSAGGAFAIAFAAIRLVPAETHMLAVPHFDLPLLLDDVLPEDDVLWLDQPLLDELLLDRPWVDDDGGAIEAATRQLATLLLDDPLPVPAADSRVVQLFADGRLATAGELSSRIDRHLARSGNPAAAEDASDTLSEALAQLRRSLRQA
jgi:hypothetical protein